jgi:hypothetical protein
MAMCVCCKIINIFLRMNTKKSFAEKFSQWYIPLICRHKYAALAFYILLALLLAFPILVKPG